MSSMELENEIALGRYKPIKDAGQRLLKGIVLASLAVFLFLTSLPYILWNIHGLSCANLLYVKTFITYLGSGVIVLAWIISVSFSLRNNLVGDYISCNIIGYEVVCWRDNKGKTHKKIFPRLIFFGGRPFSSTYFDCKIYLSLPLGGWFARGKIFNGKHIVKQWHVSLKRCFRYSSDEQIVLVVSLSDHCGDSVTVKAEEMFNIVDDPTLNKWESLVKHLLTFEHDARDRFNKLKEKQSELEDAKVTAEFKNDASLSVLIQTIDRLEATKRFIKSKQAQEIRAWLIDELLKILPDGDLRRQKYETKENDVIKF